MKKILFNTVMAAIGLFGGILHGQEDHTKVVLITLDGLRWQELFSGADPLLIGNKEYVDHIDDLKKRFWTDSPEERRRALMPFFWTEVPKMGQLHGNRNKGTNPLRHGKAMVIRSKGPDTSGWSSSEKELPLWGKYPIKSNYTVFK